MRAREARRPAASVFPIVVPVPSARPGADRSDGSQRVAARCQTSRRPARIAANRGSGRSSTSSGSASICSPSPPGSSADCAAAPSQPMAVSRSPSAAADWATTSANSGSPGGGERLGAVPHRVLVAADAWQDRHEHERRGTGCPWGNGVGSRSTSVRERLGRRCVGQPPVRRLARLRAAPAAGSRATSGFACAQLLVRAEPRRRHVPVGHVGDVAGAPRRAPPPLRASVHVAARPPLRARRGEHLHLDEQREQHEVAEAAAARARQQVRRAEPPVSAMLNHSIDLLRPAGEDQVEAGHRDVAAVERQHGQQVEQAHHRARSTRSPAPRRSRRTHALERVDAHQRR